MEKNKETGRMDFKGAFWKCRCYLLLLVAVFLCMCGAVDAQAADTDFTVTDGVLSKYSGNDTAVTIPAGVTSIGASAFAGNTRITSVTIPSGVGNIGASAFSGCTALREVSIPDSVSVIGSGAFRGCSELREVTLPSGLTQISEQTFYNCTKLRSAELKGGGFVHRDGGVLRLQHIEEYRGARGCHRNQGKCF